MSGTSYYHILSNLSPAVLKNEVHHVNPVLLQTSLASKRDPQPHLSFHHTNSLPFLAYAFIHFLLFLSGLKFQMYNTHITEVGMKRLKQFIVH